MSKICFVLQLAIVLVAASSSRAVLITSGLVYHLDSQSITSPPTSGSELAAWPELVSSLNATGSVGSSPLYIASVPELNNRPSVRFDGVNDFLTSGDVLDSTFAGNNKQFTIFVYGANWAQRGHLVSKFGSGTGEFLTRVLASGGQSEIAVANNGNNTIYRQLTSDGLTNANGANVLMFEYDGTQTAGAGATDRAQLDLSIDNAGTATGNGGTGTWDSSTDIGNTTRPLWIGKITTSGGADNGLLNADLAEILIYDRLLTPQEIIDVNAYLIRPISETSSVTIPEPSSVTLFVLGIATLMSVSKRRVRRF